jgi:hypothetical protein
MSLYIKEAKVGDDDCVYLVEGASGYYLHPPIILLTFYFLQIGSQNGRVSMLIKLHFM